MYCCGIMASFLFHVILVLCLLSVLYLPSFLCDKAKEEHGKNSELDDFAEFETEEEDESDEVDIQEEQQENFEDEDDPIDTGWSKLRCSHDGITLEYSSIFTPCILISYKHCQFKFPKNWSNKIASFFKIVCQTRTRSKINKHISVILHQNYF